jgi:hypothetical protein
MDPPKGLLTERSMDSEFDPKYIDAAMSVVSSSPSRPEKEFSVAAASTLDLKSNLELPLPSTMSTGRRQPMDDEDVIVNVTKLGDDRSITSEVSDIDDYKSRAGRKTANNKYEKPIATTKYVSKPRTNPVSVKGAVLQPYATAKIGFVPSVGYTEKKLEASKQRVVVKKPKDQAFGVATGPDMGSSRKVSVLGIDGDAAGGQMMVKPGAPIPDNDRYFNWAAEPLFVFRVIFSIQTFMKSISNLDISSFVYFIIARSQCGYIE